MVLADGPPWMKRRRKIIKRMPSTAYAPTPAQKRAQLELGNIAYDNYGKGGGLVDGIPFIAYQVAMKAKTGEGVHGGMSSKERAASSHKRAGTRLKKLAASV